MPRTKPRPGPAAQPAAPTPEVNGPGGEVLTLVEAAAYLRVSEAAVFQAVSSQGLPGKQVGTEWRFFKGAIQQWLSTGGSTAQT